MLGLDVISFSISMSFFYCFNIKKKKKKIREKMPNYIFFLSIAFQILYMFLPDILVHCALIKYAYI
jgi:hypothetical protein